MSNIIELSAFKGARSSENDATFGYRATGRPYRRSERNMHTFVFRSYDQIVKSAEADLVRDVCFDIEKAQSKLKAIRRQMEQDRKHAAARAKLLTSCETKLSAAIDTALTRTPTPLPEVEQPRTNAEVMVHRREFKEAMRRRIRIIALFRDLSVEEIKLALTLKHHEISKFTEKHGVNLEWLLEGRGPIFKGGANIEPMSPAEFALAMRTLPEDQQRKIKTLMDLFLEYRNR
jgi:hypothetical protein